MLRLLPLLVLLAAGLDASAQQAPASSDHNVIVASLLRPQQVSLEGPWYFRQDPDDSGERAGWFRPGTVRGRTSLVPLPWQLAFPDLREYLGTAWYERDFLVPSTARGKRVALNFLGVDNFAKVWINGKPAGEHEGALTPFVLDISSLVRFGENNTVTVRVNDPEYGTRVWTNEQIIASSGLLREVYLEITGPQYVSDIFVMPDIDRCAAEARVTFGGAPLNAQGGALRVTIQAPDAKVFVAEKPLPAGTSVVKVRVPLGRCVLWDLDHPALYQIQADLIRLGRRIDSATAQFGMRKLSIRGKNIVLNNRPIYVVGGWLDTSPYGGPDEVNWALPPPYRSLSDQDVQRDLRTAKALNVNYVRRILRSVNPRFLYWADRMGVLVQEGGPWMPASGIKDREAFSKYKQGWRDIIERDRNHPSVAVWELFTENSGLAAGDFASWKKSSGLLEQTYDYAKSLDPTRLALDDSGGRSCCTINYPGNHVKTDIDDVLFLGDASTSWIQGIEEYREYAARIKQYGKPVIDSLLHNLTSRVVDADKARRIWSGQTPWWFTAPARVTSDSTNLTGFEDRFYKWGFNKIFGDFTAFTRATDRYEFEGIKFQAEEMRKNPELVGYLGFLFDTPPHFIGAVDVFRRPKVFFDELSRINTQDLAMIDLPRRNFWSGETVRAGIYVSHYGTRDISGSAARWWLEGSPEVHGVVRYLSVPAANVRRVGTIEFTAPQVRAAQPMRIHVRIDKGGETFSENYADLRVFPLSDQRAKISRVSLYGFSGTLATRLEILGYEPADQLDRRGGIVISNKADGKLSEFVRNGGKALLLTCDELDLIGFNASPKVHPLEEFLQGHGILLGGRNFHYGGITGAHFVNKSFGLFSRIPFENPIDWPFYRVMPQNVLIGLSPEQQPDIVAGAYGSFFRNKPVDSNGKTHSAEVTGTIVQFRYGKGKLLISTFDLLKALGDDPVATIMFNDLVAYAAGEFRPQTELRAE